ncbi:unnamed protein product [Echinostoma caproni]|uniref:Fibronectin type-III domain-containing protein n=1 Tax=Echinostoma caproni TaxID=27848 RepID=A0A183AR36_9TREM|nr:unnamed protein product [Echinostoma caproni]
MKAQRFVLQLIDHGYRAPTETTEDHTGMGASWSELTPSRDTEVGQKHQVRLRIGHVGQVNLSGLLPSHVYTVTIRGENGYGEGPGSIPVQFTTPDLTVPQPKGITIDRNSGFVHLPADNPALCAQIERMVQNSAMWLPVEIPHAGYVIQTPDGQYKVKYPSEHTVGSKYCVRLIWDMEVKIPMEGQSAYRIKYCHTGNPTRCSTFVYPSRDLPAMVLFAVGGACVLAVSILFALLTHFAWSHLKRRETKNLCVATDSQSRSSYHGFNEPWFTSNSVPDQIDDAGLLTQIAPLLPNIDPVTSVGGPFGIGLTSDKRTYDQAYHPIGIISPEFTYSETGNRKPPL